jgi:hypothetical protein
MIDAQMPDVKPTHVVLDMMYTEEEGQESFHGSYQECEDFIIEQNQHLCVNTYKTVPIIKQ